MMRTVTICGSMKFEKEMQRIAFLLEAKHNMNILQCVYNVDDLDITPMEQAALENAHYRKIELSDAIYVVDIQGYIGNQVSKEIAFAQSKGKEVIFHSAYRENNFPFIGETRRVIHGTIHTGTLKRPACGAWLNAGTACRADPPFQVCFRQL